MYIVALVRPFMSFNIPTAIKHRDVELVLIHPGPLTILMVGFQSLVWKSIAPISEVGRVFQVEGDVVVYEQPPAITEFICGNEYVRPATGHQQSKQAQYSKHQSPHKLVSQLLN
jgi:hypothetical protein